MIDTRVQPPPVSTGRRAEPRPRKWLLAAALAVVPLGLLVRQLPGALGDIGGGVLFTVLVGLIVLAITPTTRAGAAGTIAFAVSAAVELIQSTSVPAALSVAFPPARWVLGSTFAAADFTGYAVGGVAVAVLAASGIWGRLAARE